MSSSQMARTLQLPQTRHFFKVMIPGFSTKLSIPLAFCRHLSREKSEKAMLSSCKGSWHVRVSRGAEGRMNLKEGWTDFVQHHDLSIGDFLVFEHKGGLVFHVLVFDSSSCEKDYPLPLSLSAIDSKRRKSLQSNTHITHSKRESAVEAPYFIETIKAFNCVCRKPYMNIPKKFVISNGLIQKHSIILRNPSGKLWLVKLQSRVSYARANFAGGWHEFLVGNNLKEGDMCIFQHHSTSTTNGVIMDVRIFPRLT